MKTRRVAPWVRNVVAAWLLVATAAGTGRADETTAGTESAGDNRAIGLFGAAICGGEAWLIRTNPLLGMNPWALAAGIGGCLLALVDVCTT